MITRLGICGSAVEEISVQAGGPYANIIHKALAEFLAAHGHLVMGNSREMLELVRVANRSPLVDQRARQIWSILIQEMRKQRRIQVLEPGSDHTLSEISTAVQLANSWPDQEAPEIAMIPSAIIRLLFPAEESGITDPGTGVLLTSPAEFLESEPVQRLKTLRHDSRLSFGETRISFWQRVLKPLVASSREINIYDRYLFSELMRRSQLPPSPTQAPEALVWLLRQLDAEAPDGLVVRLFGGTAAPPQYGSAQHPDSAECAHRILVNSWVRSTHGAVARVEILAGDWKQRGVLMPHDRHIRFSESRAISIPAGLDRLKAPTVTETAGMAWRYHWTSSTVAPFVASEKELEAGSLTNQVVL
ncbi:MULTISPECIES: hypothetical protein [unclassified Arthrobacter]|uniref:hypothetical protein n=1 Tax=unclassified Arthrobacter TaxID=235627 RepID=UPI0011B0EED4|nr:MULTISPECIES: hypothetical protein [unclassified Arthrobacter]